MKSPWILTGVALGIAVLAACSSEQPPTAPRTYSLSGHVRLTGFLVDEMGHYAGTRIVGDADGVTVELLHGTDLVARTTTVGGVYHFSGLAPGGYVARSQVTPKVGDETNPMTIAVSDVHSADTLRLVSYGELVPVPNPFVDTTRVYFDVPDTLYIDVEVLDVSANLIKSLLSLEVRPARHRVIWNGSDLVGHQVTGSLFWITYRAGDDIRTHLLLRE